jgi:WD40 repeat protein
MHWGLPIRRRIAMAWALALALACGPLPWSHAQGGAGRSGPTADPVLRIDTPMHQSMIRRLAVDGAGERIVTAGDDKTVRVWQLARRPAGGHTARLVQTLRVPIDAGHEGQLFALAVSPDGTRIAAAGWTCWDWERAGCVYVFDAESGEIVRRVRGLPDAVGALAWSPDGRHLAIGLQGRAGLRVLRTDRFEEVAADREFADKVMELAYDPAGRLAAVSLDGRLRVYRADHRLHGRLALSNGRQPATVRFDAPGRRIAVGFLDTPTVTVLDAASLETQTVRRVTDPAQRNLSNVAWSPDGTTLQAAGERTGGGPNLLYRWLADGSQEPQRVPVPAERISELQALPAGAVAWSAEDPRFGIVDVDGRLTLDRPAEITGFSDTGSALRSSADGTVIGFTGADGRERVFAVEAAAAAASRDLPAVAAVAPNPPGWRIELAPDRMAIQVNGRAVALDDYEAVRVQAIHPSGESLFLGTEWALRRIDATGASVWRVRLAAIVRGVVVSADGQWVIAALSDGTIRWYRSRDGSERLAYFPHANGDDWIAWIPSGYYMSSLHGDQYVGWHVNRGPDRAPDFHRAVQFERVLYRPDIVKDALRASVRPAARQIAPPEHFDRARLAQIAPPRLALRVLGVTQADDGTARARIRITGERGAQPLRELAVYVNEIPVTHTDERSLGWLDARRLEREVNIPLSALDNDIRVESYTEVSMGVAEGFVRLQANEAGWADRPVRPPRGDLYVLAIGNNAFAQLPPASTLEFAARDAEAVAATLAARGQGLFRQVHVEVLSDQRARKADRRSVLEALAMTRRARAEDTVVVFLASHGVSDRDGNYWFVPRDAREADLRAIEAGSTDRAAGSESLISWSVFFDALRQTAGRRLLIVDTCQARGIEGRFESFALMKRSAASRFSMMVAAQSDEESQEYPPGRHGLFTYGLLQALAPGGAATRADADGDGRISIAEAFGIAAPLVARLHDRTLGSQTPALITPAALADTPLAAAR